MGKYALSREFSPEKLVEHLGNEMGEGFRIESKALKAGRNRVYVRKNPAMGCTLRHVDEGETMVYFGPFPYWSIWAPVAMLVGFLIIASVGVTVVTGKFNIVIAGLGPVVLTAILIRVASIGVVRRVGAIMRALTDQGN